MGSQYQIIIGQNVAKVYDAFCSMVGMATGPAEDSNAPPPRRKLTLRSIGGSILDYMAGSMTPVLPIVLAGGLFRAILGVAVLSTVWQFLVITGIHLVIIYAGYDLFFAQGYDTFILPCMGYAFMAATGMASLGTRYGVLHHQAVRRGWFTLWRKAAYPEISHKENGGKTHESQFLFQHL